MMHFVRHIGDRLTEATAVSAALQEDLELKQLFEKFSLGTGSFSFSLNYRLYQLILLQPKYLREQPLFERL